MGFVNCRSVGFVAALALVGLQPAGADILGTAHNFAVLGGATVTSNGPTLISGDLGVWTGTAVTGFPPAAVVMGSVHMGNTFAAQAQGDVTRAYNVLAGMTPTQVLTGSDLGGMTLTPGVYFFSTSAQLTGVLTLDGVGNPNSRFVFQMGSTLTTANSSSVVTINGADGRNVYWQVGSSATLGTASAFQGSILAQASITLNTGATILDGRALARTGVVTMASNTIRSGATKVLPAAAQADAHFGASLAGSKDFNGDGRADVLVGSPEFDFPGIANAGRVQIYNGFTGALVRTITPPNRQTGGLFGASITGLDKADADAFGDLLVGAPRQHPGAAPLNAGRAYLFSGSSGAMIRAVKSPFEQAGSLFGWAVAAVPDVNGDGRTDYLISAPGETVGPAAGAGRVYLYSGLNGVWLRTFFSPVYEAGGSFGWSVAGVPDVTGDGRGDVLIGSPRADPGVSPADAGRAFLFNGATGAFIRVFGSPTQEAGGHFGWSVAGVPDANNDGRGEILIGAPGESPGTSPAGSGRAYLFSGATGVRLRTLSSPNAVLNGEFGACVTGLRDANGDGRGDACVGAPGESVGALVAAGRAYIVSGTNGVVYRSLFSPAREAGGRFGAALGSGVDPNTNCDEVLIGAPFEDPQASPDASGRVYINRN